MGRLTTAKKRAGANSQAAKYAQFGSEERSAQRMQPVLERAGANSQAAALSKSWGDILAAFDDLLEIMKSNAVPKVLVQVRL